jgi:membrane-associated phospholipid phosphatase
LPVGSHQASFDQRQSLGAVSTPASTGAVGKVVTMSNVTDFLIGLDHSLYLAVNDLCGLNPTLDRIAVDAQRIRGTIVVGIVGALWFWPEDRRRRRETIIIMILAIAISLILNRTVSTLLPFRDRPMYTHGAKAPGFPWHADLEHWSSFPSDTATLLFAIAAGFWLGSRWLGLVFGVFAISTSLARVYLGLHYPSDILVGALLGIGTSMALHCDFVRRKIAAPILAIEMSHPPYFYGVFFVILSELADGFPVTRRIAVAVVHLFRGYSR